MRFRMNSRVITRRWPGVMEAGDVSGLGFESKGNSFDFISISEVMVVVDRMGISGLEHAVDTMAESTSSNCCEISPSGKVNIRFGGDPKLSSRSSDRFLFFKFGDENASRNCPSVGGE